MLAAATRHRRRYFHRSAYIRVQTCHSSTKPEVHNVLHCRRRRTDRRLQLASTINREVWTCGLCLVDYDRGRHRLVDGNTSQFCTCRTAGGELIIREQGQAEGMPQNTLGLILNIAKHVHTSLCTCFTVECPILFNKSLTALLMVM